MKQHKKDSRDRQQVVDRAARAKPGYEQLRPSQKEAITALLDGHHTLAVMPTGAGKSAIYQIAGSLIPGDTIVVSPLIALQRDQVESITEEDMGGAVLVNSTLRPAEREEALDEYEEGPTELRFLAPEQFTNEETLARLQASKPSLFVVDETHCISDWGHDFRPEYLALTTTASPPVQEEIVERLGMREPRIIVRGFDRPNIHLAVESFADEEEKRETLIARVVEAPKPGIVYAATCKHTEELTAALAARGVNAVAYHAGMATAERTRVQDAFMSDAADVIVATTAFGMGVDKPNVRFVYHLDVSDSIDSYYQEIGRAGRDGEPAEAVLFYRPEDLNLRRFFAGSGQVDAEQMEQVAEFVQDADGPLELEEISEKVDLSKAKVTVALSWLEEVSAVDVLPTGEVVAINSEDLTGVAEEAAEAQENLRKFTRSRIEMMRGYADMRDCRREYILNYFGESYTAPCNNCDTCLEGVAIATPDAAQPFPLKSRVEHKEWGPGMVMRYARDTMVVLFDSVGYRTLAVELVMAKELLTLAG